MPRGSLFFFLTCLIALGCSTSKKTTGEEKAYFHAQMALGHFNKGDFPRALGQYLEAEKSDPKNENIQNQLGLTYYMLKKPTQALEHFDRAISLKSNFTEAKNNKARVLIEVGRYEEARALLREVRADLTYPNPHKVDINLGLLEFERGQFETAKRHFLAALKVDRENCPVYTYYARSMYELGQYREADPVLNRAIEVCRGMDTPEPLYFSGMNYYKLGDTARAKARFREVMELYPLSDNAKGAMSMLKLLETR